MKPKPKPKSIPDLIPVNTNGGGANLTEQIDEEVNRQIVEQWLCDLDQAFANFTFETFLEGLESCPTEVRTHPNNTFEPKRLMIVHLLKEAIQLESQRLQNETPLGSQVAAVCALIQETFGFTFKTAESYTAACIPLRHAVASSDTIDEELLKRFDDHFFSLLLLKNNRDKLPSGFEDRVRYAAQRNDTAFFIRLGEFLSRPTDFNRELKTRDFQLGAIQTFLLNNWKHIEGWEPEYGLCQFSRKALHAYCNARIYPFSMRVPRITLRAVENARQKLRLNRPPRQCLLVKKVLMITHKGGRPRTDMILLFTQDGTPIEHKKVCTINSDLP